MQVPQNIICCNRMVVSHLYHELDKGENKVFNLVLTGYIKDLISYPSIMGSTKSESEVESLNLFRFISIGESMDL
jgi:hypothetical protein